jgi:DNA-binding CsgD family transcriptional regulator
MPEVGDALSERELVVLERLADGSTNREIAQDLNISHNTVKVHLRNIFQKLGVSSRTEAITVAIQKGLLTVPAIPEEPDQKAEVAEVEPVPLPAAEVEDLKSEPVDSATEAVDASAAPSSNWRLLALGLLLIVVLLVGVIFGPRLTGNGNGNNGESPSESLEPGIAQPIADSDWLTAKPLPRERKSMALVAVGLDLFQIGGEVGAGVVNLVDIFETGSGQWRSGAAKPTAVADASAAVLFGEIYVPGGRLADGQPTSVVEAYSPANNAWRPVTPLPRPSAGNLTFVDDGLLYVIGGWDGINYLADGYVFDPSSEEWQQIPPMDEGRAYAAGGVLSSGLYIVGGVNESGELGSCQFYVPIQEEWSDCPPMQAPRSRAGGAVLGNDRLYVFGGGVENDVLYGEVFEAKSAAWQEFEMPMLKQDSSWHSLGATNVETRIYVLGGQQGEDILLENYIYAPFIHQTFLPSVGDEN